MAANKDWFPGTRDEQLTMCKNWVTILQTKKSAWGIPDTTFTNLSGKVNAADALALAICAARCPAGAMPPPDPAARCTE
jgi:hypothetical protein